MKSKQSECFTVLSLYYCNSPPIMELSRALFEGNKTTGLNPVSIVRSTEYFQSLAGRCKFTQTVVGALYGGDIGVAAAMIMLCCSRNCLHT